VSISVDDPVDDIISVFTAKKPQENEERKVKSKKEKPREAAFSFLAGARKNIPNCRGGREDKTHLSSSG